MDVALIKEYGLAVFILIGAAKGLQIIYKNMREDKKINDENMCKMLTDIQKNAKEREEKQLVYNEKRDDKIIEAMKEQATVMKDINTSINSNTSELIIFKRILEEMKKESA